MLQLPEGTAWLPRLAQLDIDLKVVAVDSDVLQTLVRWARCPVGRCAALGTAGRVGVFGLRFVCWGCCGWCAAAYGEETSRRGQGVFIYLSRGNRMGSGHGAWVPSACG